MHTWSLASVQRASQPINNRLRRAHTEHRRPHFRGVALELSPAQLEPATLLATHPRTRSPVGQIVPSLSTAPPPPSSPTSRPSRTGSHFPFFCLHPFHSPRPSSPIMAFVAAAPLSLNRRPALAAASSPALAGAFPVCPTPASVVVARPAKWSMARVAKVRWLFWVSGMRRVYLEFGFGNRSIGNRAMVPAWGVVCGTLGHAFTRVWFNANVFVLCLSTFRFLFPSCPLPVLSHLSLQFGPFTPALVLTRLVIGDKPLNKLRGKGIALHSQVRFLSRVCPPTLPRRPWLFMHRRSGLSCFFEADLHAF